MSLMKGRQKNSKHRHHFQQVDFDQLGKVVDKVSWTDTFKRKLNPRELSVHKGSQHQAIPVERDKNSKRSIWLYNRRFF